MRPKMALTAAQLAGAVRSELSHVGCRQRSSLRQHVFVQALDSQALGLACDGHRRTLRHAAWLPVATLVEQLDGPSARCARVRR
jgi:hypothetical protein